MKLALLADVHSNLQALQACLDDARARGATHHAFLGDLVGYGADPGAVVDVVREMCARGAWAVKGNHDDASVAPVAGSRRVDQAGAAWTHDQLSADQRDFLERLPLTVRAGRMLLVHASAHEPAQWTYVTRGVEAAQSLDAARAEGADIVFGGHVHEQRLFYMGAVGKLMAFEPTSGVPVPVPAHREWLATAGSVGQPRDGDPRAMYAMFDADNARLTFMRIAYDHAAAADAIRRAGLPEANAQRLAKGQ